jgi:hypothetical protein
MKNKNKIINSLKNKIFQKNLQNTPIKEFVNETPLLNENNLK